MMKPISRAKAYKQYAYELDPEAQEALNDYHQGLVTEEELKDLIGSENAAAALREIRQDSAYIAGLFDDPESF